MARLIRTARDASPRRRGLALVEAAIVFPILFLLTFGVIEYGWLFLKCQQITNAARQGARVGATPDATNGDVQSAITAILGQAGIGSFSVSMNPGDVTTPAVGDPLTVTVTVQYSDVALTGAGFLPVPADIRSTVTMAKEGP